jgi:hypothetical protein
MKHYHSPRGGRLMIGLLAGLCTLSSAFAAEAVPTGTLNVDRTLVRVGSRSQLDWKIQYPTASVTLTPKTNLTMRVRLLGASFYQSKANNGGGNNYDSVDSSNPNTIATGAYDPSAGYDDEIHSGKVSLLPFEVMWSLNSATWSKIYSGTQSGVNPTNVVLNKTVKPGDTINFGARGYRDKAWLPFYSTATASPNVVVLENGATLPSIVQQSSVQNILSPYLDSNNKIKIGTRNLIILMELGQTNPNYADFNLQDLVILVTFE